MNNELKTDRTIMIILIAGTIMTACAIAIVLIFMFLGVSLPWAKSPTSQPTDPTWLRIQNTGRMVVGMSPDYPPFAFVGEDFSVQGYDLALIQEISKRLGIPLEIRSMAFDGLVNALVLQQIDVAVAALSLTPERDQIIDFSNVYYVGEDAILVRNDSPIQIATVNDMANYRIGFQKGSVYEDWVRDNLIGPGLMSPQMLYTYQTKGEALQALTSSDPDIAMFMLDFQPAEKATQDQPVKILTRGLNPQQFAIGIPQGAATLQERLNQALTEMKNDGTLDALAKTYLNVNQPLPLPTPAPTQPPATPSACLDGMRFVQDLSFPDSNMTSPPQVQPGEAIQKGWRIQNSGTCVWDASYALVYTGSAPPNAPVGGNPVAIQGQVAPGQTYDVYTTIFAPSQPGRYQSFWNMRASNGAQFGDRLWAGFEVVSPVPPTPGPEAPTIYRFQVDRSQILQGQCIQLDWQFGGQNITYSRIFRNNVLFWFDLPFAGNTTDCPPGTGQVEYRLVLDSAAAGSVAASQFVTIFPNTQPTLPPPPTPEQPPQIIFFNVDTSNLSLGECVNLSWSYSGSSIVNAQITRNNELIGTDAPPLGSQQDCPAQVGQYLYVLRVDSEYSGFTQASQSVRVRNPQPSGPVINSFSAQPDQITLGQCVSLNWVISADNQSFASLSRNGEVIASEVSFTGSFQDCINDPNLASQVLYLLQVTGPGGSAAAQDTVQVEGGLMITPRSP